MVVDEELKMMCDICHEGGQVLGPFLKPMTHLVHTEYLLAGRTDRDVREVLRDTMYAATVTGSPVENACRLIKKYEPEGRGYYGAALALLGRDAAGRPTADSPIVIRTADVGLDGTLKVTAGATLVRDSEAAHEVAETHAKAGGILAAFGLVRPGDVGGRGPRRADPRRGRRDRAGQPQPAAQPVLADRPGRLAAGARAQGQVRGDPRRRGRLREHAPARPGGDGHDQLRRPPRGLHAGGRRRVRPGDRRARARATRATPSTPRSPRSAPRSTCCWSGSSRSWRSASATRCCAAGSASTWRSRTSCSRAPSRAVDLGEREENVGFYNTFVGRVGAALPPGVSTRADPLTGDVHLVEGPHFRGIQFHAESILTEHGYDLIHDLVLTCCTRPDRTNPSPPTLFDEEG